MYNVMSYPALFFLLVISAIGHTKDASSLDSSSVHSVLTPVKRSLKSLMKNLNSESIDKEPEFKKIKEELDLLVKEGSQLKKALSSGYILFSQNVASINHLREQIVDQGHNDLNVASAQFSGLFQRVFDSANTSINKLITLIVNELSPLVTKINGLIARVNVLSGGSVLGTTTSPSVTTAAAPVTTKAVVTTTSSSAPTTTAAALVTAKTAVTTTSPSVTTASSIKPLSQKSFSEKR